ncbi:hypothetical protein F2P56_003434 [Juglans regia]|uniref:Protein NBR1 homolog n=2 Tax=Juglans regia TaxID=51240 RepID=A0A2I4E3A6_JUGRE|nr:protein NBR1 homolog [Juglans regia]KAF5476724.1 hypothetical protein F2P56_003434 [Juglans regia]
MDFSKNTKVIKIKFGDTVKRMKVHFDAGHTDLTMTDLRKKIHHTFKFPADADFILTYVDEDGDVVTLFDDDDLSDALTQSMEVLKINVQLSNNKLGIDYYAQSGGSTSATVSKSVLQRLSSWIWEALLPLYEALSKIVSKAVSDPDLFDSISKTAQTYLDYLKQSLIQILWIQYKRYA